MGIIDGGGKLNPYAVILIRKKARSLVGKYGFTKSDLEDIEQDLSMDLLKRQSGFDPEKSSATTFITIVVNNCVATVIEHRKAEKRDYRIGVYSLDEEIDCGDDSSMLRHELVNQDSYLKKSWETAQIRVANLDCHLDCKRAIQSLPPALREIALLLCRVSITEAANITGIPRTTINDMRNAIREIFKKMGIDGWLK